MNPGGTQLGRYDEQCGGREGGDATQISVDLVFVPIQGGRGRLRQSATACTHEYTRYRAVQRDLNKKMN